MEKYICKKVSKLEDESVDNEPSFIFSNIEYNDNLFKAPFSSEKNKLLILCILSKLIYEHQDEHLMNVMLKNWGIEYEVFSVEKGVVYGIFYTSEFLVLSFKGTSTLSDVLHDVNFIQTDDEFNIPGKLHGGFENMILENNTASKIKSRIDTLIEEKNINKDHIYITGHSLGGALAGIFCCYYLTRKINEIKPKLVTFGAPRSGNKEFANVIVENSVRVVNGNDIVTSIPIFYYRHFKNLYHIGSYFSCHLLTDHHLSKYYKQLMKLQD